MLDIWLVREIRVSQVYPFREMRMKIGEYRAQFDWWIAFFFAVCFSCFCHLFLEKHQPGDGEAFNKGNDFSTAGRILIDWNGRLSPSNIKEAFNLIGTLLVPHRPTHPRLFHSAAPSSADPPPLPSTPALP